ncbi:MAG: hypothetical protein ACOY3F_02720, partial [Bacillota bacterium]
WLQHELPVQRNMTRFFAIPTTLHEQHRAIGTVMHRPAPSRPNWCTLARRAPAAAHWLCRFIEDYGQQAAYSSWAGPWCE